MFKTFPCTECKGGAVSLHTHTKHVEYFKGTLIAVPDSLELPQCDKCKALYLNDTFENLVVADFEAQLATKGEK